MKKCCTSGQASGKATMVSFTAVTINYTCTYHLMLTITFQNNGRNVFYFSAKLLLLISDLNSTKATQKIIYK